VPPLGAHTTPEKKERDLVSDAEVMLKIWALRTEMTSVKLDGVDPSGLPFPASCLVEQSLPATSIWPDACHPVLCSKSEEKDLCGQGGPDQTQTLCWDL
jgi:hypothetical protein